MIIKELRNPNLSIFIAMLVLFVSCNQYESSIGLNTNDYTKYKRILSNKQLIDIGKSHNSYLTKLLAIEPQNINELSRMSIEMFSEKGLTDEIVDDYFSSIDKMNTSFLLELITDNKEGFIDANLLKQKIVEIKDINSVSLLKEHEMETRQQLTGIDLDLYLVLSTVYQYSIDFWQTYLSKEHLGESNKVLRACEWKEADGISASIGFLTLAASFAAISAVGIATGGAGIIPTVTIVASLLNIGASSALASIYTFISCGEEE